MIVTDERLVKRPDLLQTAMNQVLWKLRMHNRGIATGQAQPLRSGCPGLDSSACFVGMLDLAAQGWLA